MNKIIMLAVASLVISIWVIPLEQKAFANWGNWYQCGKHGYTTYNGYYYYYQQYCASYYGKNGIVTETIQETCYWKWVYGTWQPAGCTTPAIIYLCNPTQYPVTCNSV